MGVEKHYLGLEYAKPNEAGLASTAPEVGRRLGRLLDALGDVNEWVIARGELTDKLWQFKADLIDKLKEDGWEIRIPKNNYKVRPPKKKVVRDSDNTPPIRLRGKRVKRGGRIILPGTRGEAQ